MTSSEAANMLYELFKDKFWFQSVGVGGSNSKATLILYTKRQVKNSEICGIENYSFHGYEVVVIPMVTPA